MARPSPRLADHPLEAFGNGGQRIFLIRSMAINQTVGEIFEAIVAAVDEP